MRAATKFFASLLENGEEEGHVDEVLRHLETATHFICIVAFAKSSGWNLIQKVVAERAAEGLKATFIIGLNFYQSEPKVLRSIRQLRSTAEAAGGEINLYIGHARSRETLHPKVYWFKGPGGQALIVGSANMTWGGLAGNHELSVRLSSQAAKQKAWLDDWIDTRLDNEEIVEATEGLIKAYEKRRDIYQATMKIAEKSAARAMVAKAGTTLTLADLLVAMRADKTSEGFDASVARRRDNIPAAREQLANLARQPDLDEAAFLGAYEIVIRYWHSSGMIRGKTKIAETPAEFQAALRALSAEPSNDPAVLFDLLIGYFNKIDRAGINVLTEILHARDPARFPVMNQNSVAGMGLANITEYPRKPNKKTVDGKLYARFTTDAERLRKNLGLTDLGELDALFNYGYQHPKDDDDD